MSFFNVFKKKKNGKHVQVTERKQNTLNDTAAAVAFSDAGEHETARSMIDKSKGSRTILVVVNGNRIPETLNDYALEMADRLGYTLMALHVADAPLTSSEEKRDAYLAEFKESCMGNIRALQKNAEKMGVAVSYVIECGDQDDVVAKLHTQYPGMRYVLTEPNPDIVRTEEGHAEIPVFDLGSFQPSAA